MNSLSIHGPTPIFPLRIPIPERRRIEEAAKKLGLSAAAFIRQAAEARLQQMENDNDLTRIGDKPNLPPEAATGVEASVGKGRQDARDEHGGVYTGSCLGQGI